MRKVFMVLRCVVISILDVIAMKRHDYMIGSHTCLRAMLGAGVLAVLLLARAGTAAGAMWVVDDGGGMTRLLLVAAAEGPAEKLGKILNGRRKWK
jgi:hypothetical protein